MLRDERRFILATIVLGKFTLVPPAATWSARKHRCAEEPSGWTPAPASANGPAGATSRLMWLTGRLVPDHKTIADFRKDNGPAIRKVCAQFVMLCPRIGLLTKPSVAIDGSKFKAVNNRDKNFTRAKMERRLAQIDESVARFWISSTPPICRSHRRGSQ
jgi:hypothetical protein